MNADELAFVKRHFPELEAIKAEKLCKALEFAHDLHVVAAGGEKQQATREFQALWNIPWIRREFPEVLKAAVARIRRERQSTSATRKVKKEFGRPPAYVFIIAIKAAYREASELKPTLVTCRSDGNLIANRYTDFVQDAFRLHGLAAPTLNTIRRATVSVRAVSARK
jgi:hypothetical protein